MSFTETDLDNLSVLARIDVKPEEKQKMLADMQAIIGYVSEINEEGGRLQVEGGNERADAIFNIVREDIVTRETGTNTKNLLDNAPATEDGYVKVTQVFK